MGCAGSDLNEGIKAAGDAASKAADDVKKGADEAKKTAQEAEKEAKKTVDEVQKEVKQTEAEAKKAVADAEKEVKKVETDAKKEVADAEKEVKKAQTDATKAVEDAKKDATKAVDSVKSSVDAAAKSVAAVFAPVKLYGMALSTCTRRVLMTLEEKNVPYELIVVDLMKGEQKKPEFLAIQPFGQIPVLVDGDITIFESRSIARYIATKWASQGTDLLGKDVVQQALTDTWLEVESNHYNGPVSTIVAEKVFKTWKGETADEAVVAAKVEELNKVLDVYEQRLSKSAYLTGPDFSLADLSHLSYTHYLIHGAKITEPLDKHPAVKAWWDKISSRPAWIKLTAE